MNKKIAIIGAGEIGRALEKILQAKSGLKIQLWDKDESRVSNQSPLSSVVKSADFLFLAIPSKANKFALADIVPDLKKSTIVVSLSKGIEVKSLKTVDQILEAGLPTGQAFGLLAGPMLAEEIETGLMAAGVIASSNLDLLSDVVSLFAGTSLKIETSKDVRGTALAGVFKNVYAIGLGIIDGLEYGKNAKGWFLSASLSEISEILHLLGGKRETAYGSAGLADLVATGFSEHSSNHQLGYKLGKYGESDVMSEGLYSMPAILKLLSNKAESFPLLQSVKKIILDKKYPKKIFKYLLF